MRLVLHQARFDLLAFIRNQQARFFTLALPVIFLVIFVSVFGDNTVGPNHVKASTYYVPGLAALGVIAGSIVNLVISITAQRESGVLKRRRSTPVPAWVLIAGRALTAVVVALSVMTVLLLIGRFGYGVTLPTRTLLGVVLTAVLGAVTFCCLGYALSTAIRSADAAQPMVQALMLPPYFISGVFIPRRKVRGRGDADADSDRHVPHARDGRGDAGDAAARIPVRGLRDPPPRRLETSLPLPDLRRGRHTELTSASTSPMR